MQSVTGLIQVRAATDSTVLGYVIENTGNNNHFGLGYDPTVAISVSFAVDPTVTVSGQLDITATVSSPPSYVVQFKLNDCFIRHLMKLSGPSWAASTV